MRISNYKNKIKNCQVCGNEFKAKKDCQTRNQLFCSLKCYWESLKGSKPTEKQLEALESGRKIPRSNKGSHWSEESKLNNRGKNNHRWRGGITPINFQIRNSPAMKEWKKKVFERDNWTCRECGVRGGKLVADHIKPFSLFPKLRFDINNGRTICKECDLKSDTYGGRAYKKYHNEFINKKDEPKKPIKKRSHNSDK